jgi:hypothetical protein
MKTHSLFRALSSTPLVDVVEGISDPRLRPANTLPELHTAKQATLQAQNPVQQLLTTRGMRCTS